MEQPTTCGKYMEFHRALRERGLEGNGLNLRMQRKWNNVLAVVHSKHCIGLGNSGTTGMHFYRCFKKCTCKVPGDQVQSKKLHSEHCPQETYRKTFFETPCR
jgi:hypothetical protein